MSQDNVLEYYSRKLADNMATGIDNFLFDKPVKYRKQTVVKYLQLPVLSITKDYDNDSEYGTGEFRGLLVAIKWIETRIPVGKKVIEVPVLRKHKKGAVIRFKRYGGLDSMLNEATLTETGRETDENL